MKKILLTIILAATAASAFAQPRSCGLRIGASGFEGDDFFGDSRFNFYLGFRPGVNIALSQKVGMVAKLGFIGYEFVDDAYHTFGINLNNSPLTFGMYYNF